MKVNSSYVHALEGRLRLKVPEVKGAPRKAREIERHLAQAPGVDEVSANPVTGSVLILYNPRLISQEEFTLALQEIGCLEELQAQAGGAGPPSRSDSAFGKMATAVASAVMELALTRLVVALI
jgi:hypothetical protein